MLVRWGIGVLVAVLLVMLYGSGLEGAFLFDDFANIVNNMAIHIDSLSITSLQAALTGPTAGPLGRPVSVLSFALTYYFCGLSPFAFKSVNLAIHFGNSVLLHFFLIRVLSDPGHDRRYTERVAFGLALLWLLHPVNLTPILMAVQRMTLLATFFSLASLLCHLQGIRTITHRRWLWWGLAWGVLWPLAVLSKETALVLPLLALLSSAYVLRDEPFALRLIRGLAGASLMLTFGALAWGWTWLQSAYTIRPFSLAQRLLTESRVLWTYFDLVLAPRFESFAFFMDDVKVSVGLLSPTTTAVALAAWLAVLALIVLFRRSLPLFSFGLSWFLLGHLLESTVIPLEIAFEHRNYLPSLGLLLALTAVAEATLAKSKTRFPEKCFLAFLGAFVCYAGVQTWIRSNHFRDPLQFATLEATYHPESSRANLAAAVALMDAGYGAAEDFSAQAIRAHLLRSAQLDPHGKFAYLYLMIWSCSTGREVEPAWLQTLEQRLANSPIAPIDIEIPMRFGNFLMGAPNCLRREQVQGIFSSAVSNSSVAAGVRAQFLEVWSDYELLVSGDLATARLLLKRAVALDITDVVRMKKLEGYKN